MDILYRPKFVIHSTLYERVNLYDDSTLYKTYSGLEWNLYGSLFQLEFSKIIEPNEKLEFNITKIFNDYLLNNENIKSNNLKKFLKIKHFNILFCIDKNWTVVWPQKTETKYLQDLKNGKLKMVGLSNSSKDELFLTYDEYVIKNILE